MQISIRFAAGVMQKPFRFELTLSSAVCRGFTLKYVPQTYLIWHNSRYYIQRNVKVLSHNNAVYVAIINHFSRLPVIVDKLFLTKTDAVREKIEALPSHCPTQLSFKPEKSLCAKISLSIQPPNGAILIGNAKWRVVNDGER